MGVQAVEVASVLPGDTGGWVSKSSGIRALVVDDDIDIGNLVADVLRTEGLEPFVLTAPEQAMAKLAEQDFHIMIVDMMMPGMSGSELLSSVRAVDRDLAVIVMTGYPTLDNAVHSIEHEVSAYLRKPFEISELKQAVHAILERKGLAGGNEERLLMQIGQAIRDARKSQQLTLKQLARRTSLSVSLLSQIERAETAASISSLFRISKSLGIPMTLLFKDA